MNMLEDVADVPPLLKAKGGGDGDGPTVILAFLVAQMIACKGHGQASMLLPYVIEATLQNHPDAALFVTQIQVEREDELSERVKLMDAAGLIKWRPTGDQAAKGERGGEL